MRQFPQGESHHCEPCLGQWHIPSVFADKKAQAGIQARATKAHNCVGWPRRRDQGEETNLCPQCTASAGSSYLKSAMHRLEWGCGEEEGFTCFLLQPPRLWKKLCICWREKVGPRLGQQGVVQSEIRIKTMKVFLHSKNPKVDSGLSETNRGREVKICHPAETLKKWGHCPWNLKV